MEIKGSFRHIVELVFPIKPVAVSVKFSRSKHYFREIPGDTILELNETIRGTTHCRVYKLLKDPP